jgi:hypothetical protein
MCRWLVVCSNELLRNFISLAQVGCVAIVLVVKARCEHLSLGPIAPVPAGEKRAVSDVLVLCICSDVAAARCTDDGNL